MKCENKFIVSKKKCELSDKIALDLALVGDSLGSYDLVSEFLKCEEKVLTSVLEMILKREPELDDFKRLTKLYYTGYTNYELAFDGVKIGSVDINHTNNNFGYEFTPHIDWS